MAGNGERCWVSAGAARRSVPSASPKPSRSAIRLRRFCYKKRSPSSPLLAWLLLAEPLGRRFWICLLLALCGAYVVNFGLSGPGGAIERKAALLALAAAALWGCSTVLGRFVLAKLSFFALTCLRIILAAPLLIALNGTSALSVSLRPREAVSLLLMALIPGLLALLIYYRGLRNARASRAAIAELAFAGTATILNWIFLGAHISAIQLAGFFLLWVAILNLETKHASVGIPQPD